MDKRLGLENLYWQGIIEDNRFRTRNKVTIKGAEILENKFKGPKVGLFKKLKGIRKEEATVILNRIATEEYSAERVFNILKENGISNMVVDVKIVEYANKAGIVRYGIETRINLGGPC